MEKKYKVDVYPYEYFRDECEGGGYIVLDEYSCSNCGRILDVLNETERCPSCGVLLNWKTELTE